nr:proprotein convertase P-domain-containing protein [Arcobacter sp.]
VLISPSGTISRILTNSKTALDSVAVLEEGYRFSSVAFVDENPQGEWTLLVQSTDDKNEDTGRLMKLELEVVGYNSEDR